MEIIEVNEGNIETEHICCAIGNDKKNKLRAEAKKRWLRKRFDDGHTFKKVNVRGKVFIEYDLAENAWFPIEADGYNFIQCLWVSGRYKGHGLSRKLMEELEKDSKGRKGIVAIASPKKKGFMVEKKFYKKFGFVECDFIPPHYQMMVKKFDENAEDPRFTEKARKAKLEGGEGLTFFFSDMCPFNREYTDIMIEAAAGFDIPVNVVEITSREQAKDLPTPWGNFSVFLDEDLITHEVTTMKKFEKMLENFLD
jgi:GNAT superfamily N-acetyltransferase